MANETFSCTQIARLLAGKVTPDFNFKEQLWFIARADAREAAEYLCLLLRTQFDFQPKHDEESFFHHCLTDPQGAGHKPFSAVVLPQCAKKIAQRALVLRDARQRLQNDSSPFPFLLLPFDIRLQVYGFAFATHQIVEMDCRGSYSTLPGQTRSCCHGGYDLEVQASKGIFGTDINTSLLLANRQIFDEAEPILYQSFFLKIGQHLNEGLRFLRKLSPRARRNIRAVHIALSWWYICDGPWVLNSDNNIEAWCKLCAYMSQNLRLRSLSFNAVPKDVSVNFIDQAWVKCLVKIRGLKHLVQRDLEFPELMELRMYINIEIGPEPDEVLNSRLRALLSYLKSKMCQYPASRLLIEKEEEWDWIGNPSRGLAKSEGPDW